MNVALWIVQGLLAFAFIAAGTMKVFAYEKYKAMSEKKNGPTGPSRGLITFIGMAEIAGSLGIVLPMATNIAPWMSPWAAIGLAIIMLLAIGFHVRRHESVAVPVILFLLARFVVCGRFSQWTLTRDQTLPSRVLPGSLATRKLFRTDSSQLPRI